MVASQEVPEIWAGPKQAKVLSSPYYASLRPHLSESAINEIEEPNIKLVISMSGRQPMNHWADRFPNKIFVDEIARIERSWKLV